MTITTMEEPPLRATGKMERFNITRHHLKFYNKVQVAATYTTPRSILANPSNGMSGFKDLIYSALAKTLSTQPILGVTIEDEGSIEPKWRRLDQINLNEIVSFIEEDPNSSSDPWILAGHRELLDQVEELPLWRVVVAVQSSTFTVTDDDSRTFSFSVAFFCHHAIGDGLSGGAFHLTFLDALNNIIDNPASVTSASRIPVPKLPLVPSLEMATPLPFSFFFVLKKIFYTFIYCPVDSHEWSGPLISRSASRPPRCNLQSFQISLTILEKLVARCREEKTSITALITILMARKLALMHPTYSRFRTNIPFSMRKFTGHTPRDMGVLVSNLQPYFSSEAKPPRGYISCRSSSPASSMEEYPKHSTEREEPEDDCLWKSARECKSFITENSSTPKDQNVGLLGFVSDYAKFFLGRPGTKREHAFEVTNIGIIDGGVKKPGDSEPQKSVTFDKIEFSGAVSVYADPYSVAVATAKNGYMSVCVRWEPGVVSDEEARELTSWLEGQLKVLSGA